MIRNYLLLSIRNLRKQKWFTIFNISGLAIGMAVALLILNYVSFEFSYDKMHEKQDRIYRLESLFYKNGELTDDFPTASFGYAPAMAENMAGIEDYVRIDLMGLNRVIRYKDRKFREQRVVTTEPSFFDIFSFSLLEGDTKTALQGPNKVVITKKMVSKYFGEEDPIGKILSISTSQQKIDCEVTGIMEDLPDNSHINFDFFISWGTLPEWLENFWYMHETYTYMLLEPSVNIKNIEDAFPEMAEKYKTEAALKDKTWAIRLQPLTSIHLTPQKQYEKEAKGNRKAINILILAAFSILIIAWVNYINLTIARSLERAKEIGVRKVSGAFKTQLVSQFMLESLMLNLIAFVVAVALVIVTLPFFSQLINKQLSLIIIREPVFWMVLGATFLVGIIISGFYPAFVLSSIKPAQVLKGKFIHSQGAGNTRKVLVIFQFAASMILISGTIIVFTQLKYLLNQPLNFNPEQIVALRFPAYTENLKEKMNAFSREVKNLPEVENTSLSSCVPGLEIATFYANYRANDPTKQNKLYEMMPVDYNFIETYDLQIVAGRGFDKNFINDKNRIVINESAARSLGFATNEEAINQKVMLETQADPVEILGVVKDYHHLAANKAITPTMMLLFNRIPWLEFKYMSVKLHTKNIAANIRTIEKMWSRFFPNSTCDFHFIDQEYGKQYQQDRQFGLVFGIFAGLAIFIASVGLWVLVLFSSYSRIKELGLKKTLGATIPNLIFDLSKEFLILVGIAMLIGIPVSYFVMKNWLANFAYQTSLGWWIFALSASLALGIAIFTVSWQSWRAATRNPIEALRNE